MLPTSTITTSAKEEDVWIVAPPVISHSTTKKSNTSSIDRSLHYVGSIMSRSTHKFIQICLDPPSVDLIARTCTLSYTTTLEGATTNIIGTESNKGS